MREPAQRRYRERNRRRSCNDQRRILSRNDKAYQASNTRGRSGVIDDMSLVQILFSIALTHCITMLRHGLVLRARPWALGRSLTLLLALRRSEMKFCSPLACVAILDLEPARKSESEPVSLSGVVADSGDAWIFLTVTAVELTSLDWRTSGLAQCDVLTDRPLGSSSHPSVVPQLCMDYHIVCP